MKKSKKLSLKLIKNKQLSFTDSLFADIKREDIFVDECVNTFRNVKWLRYRSQYAKLTILEKLIVYEQLGYVLDQAATLLYKLTRRSAKYRHREHVDFLSDIYVQHSDNGITEEVTRRELLQHHENVYNKITGMFLAYNDILKKYKVNIKKLYTALEISHNAVKRLNHAI